MTLLQEHDLEAMKSQVELNKLVIEDLHNKLRDSLALVDKLEVGVAFGHSVACNYFDCHYQAERQQERMKKCIPHAFTPSRFSIDTQRI